MIDFEKIFEGWRNHLLPPSHLKEMIQRVANERLLICSTCEYNSRFHKTKRPDEHCTICSCTLIAKTKCMSCECPLPVPKWTAVLSAEQEEEIPEYEEASPN